jgi:hypothetical protein
MSYNALIGGFQMASIGYNCANCGMHFAVPQEFEDRWRERTIDTMYCPRGHRNVPGGKSEAEKLQAQLTSAERSATYYREEAERQREFKDAARRSAAARKGQITRIKNRIAKGICPACNRTFVELGRHMASQHPDFTVEREA